MDRIVIVYKGLFKICIQLVGSFNFTMSENSRVNHAAFKALLLYSLLLTLCAGQLTGYFFSSRDIFFPILILVVLFNYIFLYMDNKYQVIYREPIYDSAIVYVVGILVVMAGFVLLCIQIITQL
jgi:hypothetical protein